MEKKPLNEPFKIQNKQHERVEISYIIQEIRDYLQNKSNSRFNYLTREDDIVKLNNSPRLSSEKNTGVLYFVAGRDSICFGMRVELTEMNKKNSINAYLENSEVSVIFENNFVEIYKQGIPIEKSNSEIMKVYEAFEKLNEN